MHIAACRGPFFGTIMAITACCLFVVIVAVLEKVFMCIGGEQIHNLVAEQQHVNQELHRIIDMMSPLMDLMDSRRVDPGDHEDHEDGEGKVGGIGGMVDDSGEPMGMSGLFGMLKEFADVRANAPPFSTWPDLVLHTVRAGQKGGGEGRPTGRVGGQCSEGWEDWCCAGASREERHGQSCTEQRRRQGTERGGARIVACLPVTHGRVPQGAAAAKKGAKKAKQEQAKKKGGQNTVTNPIFGPDVEDDDDDDDNDSADVEGQRS